MRPSLRRKSHSTVDAILGHVDKNKGLSDEQVLLSREKYGANKLPEDKPKPFIFYLAMQFLQPLIIILCVLLALTLYQICKALGKNAERTAQGKRPVPVPAEYWVKFCVIVFVISVVTVFNALSNSNTGQALKELAALAGRQMAVVQRGGERREIPLADVVVGDIVLVNIGDTVPADLKVLETNDLATVEASLTGEPAEIKKTLEPKDPTAAFRSDMLYSSTSVVSGSGVGVCRYVGVNTEVGKIAQKLDVVEAVESPVERTMRRLGCGLICLVLFMQVLFVIVIWQTHQYDPAKYDGNSVVAIIFEALSLAQITLPTTLMLTVSVSMQKGVLALRQRSALLKKFTAVETLGCTNTICSDKTGTLTEGKMTAVKCCTVTRESSGGFQLNLCRFYPTRGFNPAGGIFLQSGLDGNEHLVDEVISDFGLLDADVSAKLSHRGVTNIGELHAASSSAPLPRALVGASFLNCDANTRLVKKPDGAYDCVGNMSESALVVAGAKAGMWHQGTADLGAPFHDAHADHPGVKALEVPFTSARKMKMTVHAAKGNSFLSVPLPLDATHVAILKGAPDRLEPSITQILNADLHTVEPVGADARSQLAYVNASYADEGLRVLVVAILPIGPAELATLSGMPEADDRLEWVRRRGLILLGLIGLEDPPREGVAEAVMQCHQAGIKVVMITGDQVATAASISRKINIVRAGEDQARLSNECKVLHEDPADPAGSDFVDDQQIDGFAGVTTVWARAQPVDKIAIVESLQRQGEVCAMTGDGVNDAAALKAADIGTAMGIAGTDVAKGAADMILLDDNFTTIVEAVRMGRQIYGNLQKYIYYYLGLKVCELVMFSLCVFLMLPKPIAAIRALLGKNITHDSTPLTLAFEPPEKYQMKVAPRRRSEFILTRLLVICRLVPQVVYFNFFLLGGTLVVSARFCGHFRAVPRTTKLPDWLSGKTMCLSANVCSFDGSTGAISQCKAQTQAFVCRSPIDRSMGSAEEREWYYEYGSRNDAVNIQDDQSARANFDWSGMLANGHHEMMNGERTWTPLQHLTVFNLTVASELSPFTAVIPCSVSAGKILYGDVLDSSLGPEDYKDMCWTAEAIRHFKKEKAEEGEAFPLIDLNNNRAEWSMRKMQGVAFAMFVLGELSILLSVRTEEFFLLAPRNISFYVWGAVVIAIFLMLIYVPGLNEGVGIAPLDGLGWLHVLVVAAGLLSCSEMFKRFYIQQLSTFHSLEKAHNVYMNPVASNLVVEMTSIRSAS